MLISLLPYGGPPSPFQAPLRSSLTSTLSSFSFTYPPIFFHLKFQNRVGCSVLGGARPICTSQQLLASFLFGFPASVGGERRRMTAENGETCVLLFFKLFSCFQLHFPYFSFRFYCFGSASPRWPISGEHFRRRRAQSGLAEM